MDQNTRELLVVGISVNSGYNSQLVEPVVPGAQRLQVLKLFLKIFFLIQGNH